MKKGELIVGFTLIAVSIYLYHTLSSLTWEGAIFPRILLILLTVASALFVVNTLRRKEEKPEERGLFDDAKKHLPQVLGVVVGSIIYVYFISIAGFVVSTTLFLISLIYSLGRLDPLTHPMWRGYKGFIYTVIISIVISLSIYVVFHHFLEVPVPSGHLV